MSDVSRNASDIIESLRRDVSVVKWAPPRVFAANDINDRRDLADLLSSGAVRLIVDPLDHFANELFDMCAGSTMRDSTARQAWVDSFLSNGDGFGAWVFFPWSGELVRYPDPAEHRALRTFRNRDLITVEEQRRVQEAKIAVFGLSVGSNIVDQLLQVGIGSAFLISDMDGLAPSNLNRVRASMRHVGMHKVDLVACKISEADPYITQHHLRDGYSSTTNAELDHFRPDLIVEEVDDLVVKARIRAWARQSKTPLIMVGDIGEKSVIDVERHDRRSVRPFNGRVSDAMFNRLLAGEVDEGERRRILVKVAGRRYLSTRMLQSALAVDTRLAGIPQLGSAAAAGAAIASVAVRAILLDEPLKSGTYALSPRRTLKLGRQARAGEAVTVLRAARRQLAD